MTEFVKTRVARGTGIITLDRPRSLNSLSLDMVRALTETLLAWCDDDQVQAVVLTSSSEKALCAGGDIRFFYEAGRATPTGGSALLEDFFTEEYALNHLIHFYPKPYISFMDGVVMGGGMGIAQGSLRIATDRTKMAMPEVNIGLFPDVGGSHFLSRAPGQLGHYLGLTGLTIDAADALYIGLADLFIPFSELSGLHALIDATNGAALVAALRDFAAPFAGQAGESTLRAQRAAIDAHFGAASVPAVMDSLGRDGGAFAQAALTAMKLRSPIMMSVTRAMLVRAVGMDVAACLRMERDLVRRTFDHGEVIEGVRALVIDKDNAPRWNPASLGDVSDAMVDGFFAPVWPRHAHPLRDLQDA